MRKFIAIDGESFTVDDEHRYVLMAASTGDSIYNADGLSTEECFDFLLRQMRGYTLVAFGLNYDVNMMLRDVDAKTLLMLWHNHLVRWRDYKIEWVAGKYFSVRRARQYAKVNEAFGFFQTKFVTALDKWGFSAEPEIERMKGLRGEFTPEMLPEVRRYCIAECKLLVRLMDKLHQALVYVELKPSQWVGAGSIASALLRRHGVHRHRVEDKAFPPAVRAAIMGAYYGGRNELFQQGNFERLYDYDISSAYPSEAIKLPSLTDGEWRKSRRYLPDEPFALWFCEWDLANPIVCPFPYRYKRSIHYTRNGRGWYHASEVAAAKRHHDVRVVHGWVFKPADKEPPFKFIEDAYEKRARLKATGHAGEKVLKLGLNAIYGKLAQGLTYSRPGQESKLPPFQSFYWAGAITAGTRARILDLAGMNRDALVMVATDGIFFTEPIDVETTGGLGGLELSELERVFVAQSGVYTHWRDGKREVYTRGFFSDELDFDSLELGYAVNGLHHVAEYESTRFCGLGYALTTGDLANWRRWKTSPRKLSLFPTSKWPPNYDPDQPPPVQPNIRLCPPSAPDIEASESYTVKASSHLTDAQASEKLDYLQAMEQPLRVTI